MTTPIPIHADDPIDEAAMARNEFRWRYRLVQPASTSCWVAAPIAHLHPRRRRPWRRLLPRLSRR